jgi:putative transcriptional regulator
VMEDFSDLINIKTNNVKPAQGKILISEPFMPDYYFKRSVVLLVEHNKEGTFGVIINKPMDLKFDEVVKDFPGFDSKIYLGGPVKTDSLFFIHTLGEEIENSIKIIEGLYWGGDIERVKEMISLDLINETNIRFFIGYAGWIPNQLNMELKRDSWVVSSISAEAMMNVDPKSLWKRTLLELGGQYKNWTNFPKEPAMN